MKFVSFNTGDSISCHDEEHIVIFLFCLKLSPSGMRLGNSNLNENTKNRNYLQISGDKNIEIIWARGATTFFLLHTSSMGDASPSGSSTAS